MPLSRNKLRSEVVDQSDYPLRDRKHRRYKDIEVRDRSITKKIEESQSEEASDITDDEDPDLDVPDRANLYPDLHSISGKGLLGSPRSHYSLSDNSTISEKKFPNRKDKRRQKLADNLDNVNLQSNVSSNSFSLNSIFVIVTIIFLCLSGLHFYGTSKGKEKEVRTLDEIYQVIKPDLISLKKEFPQTNQLWAQVLWQIQQITSVSPEQPSTLFLVVPEEAEVSANCFSRKLCAAVANGFQDDDSVMFDASMHTDMDADDFKIELDKSLSGLSNVHCAVVHNIDEAVAKSIILLHGYCDNENAIFKRAFIIFTMKHSAKYEVTSLPKVFEIIEERLTSAWSHDMRSVDIAALISRIATSPVLFKPESTTR